MITFKSIRNQLDRLQETINSNFDDFREAFKHYNYYLHDVECIGYLSYGWDGCETHTVTLYFDYINMIDESPDSLKIPIEDLDEWLLTLA